MSDCRLGVSPVNYPDPDPDDVIGRADRFGFQNFCSPDPNHAEGIANSVDPDQTALLGAV